MALKASICKATISISDQTRNIYVNPSITLAQHPSETSVRLMARLLAYALNYDEKLSFTKGLSTDEEPEIWQKSDDGQTLLWIDLGLIEPERIKKATRQAKQVVIYTYQGKDLKNWIDKCRGNIGSASNLQVFDIGNEAAESLAKLHNKAMNLTVMRDENDVWVSDDSQSVHIELKSLCKDSVFIE